MRLQQIEQARRQLRERAAAQDWDAVVALSRELPDLGPADADLYVLARTAREQVMTGACWPSTGVFSRRRRPLRCR